jgi:hypothetical protein
MVRDRRERVVQLPATSAGRFANAGITSSANRRIESRTSAKGTAPKLNVVLRQSECTRQR